jgi:hypothetical protein
LVSGTRGIEVSHFSMFVQDYHLGAFQALGFFGGLEGDHHTGGGFTYPLVGVRYVPGGLGECHFVIAFDFLA